MTQDQTRSRHWAFERSYRALSYEFRIRTNVEEIAGHLDRLLQPFRINSANGVPTYTVVRRTTRRPPYAVHHRGRCVQRAETPTSILDFLLWNASTRAVETTDLFIALHAGAVSWRGRGVVLPAPPDSGKTTLSAALTRAGFSYYTDEAALIDPATARLHPFPRALWMELPSIDAIPRLWEKVPGQLLHPDRLLYHISPTDIRRGAIARRAARIHFVVAPSYRKGSSTALQPMSQAEALVTLADNSFNLGRFGARGVEALATLVGGARCYRLRMGDLDTAVAAVHEVVEGPLEQ